MAEQPTAASRHRARSLVIAAGDAVPEIGQKCSVAFTDPAGGSHELKNMEIIGFYTTDIGGAEHIVIEVKHQEVEDISFAQIVRNMSNGGKGVQWSVEATSNRPEFRGKAQSWTAVNVSYS